METLQLTNLTPVPRVGLPVQEISELVRRVAGEPEAQRKALAGRDALHTMRLLLRC